MHDPKSRRNYKFNNCAFIASIVRVIRCNTHRIAPDDNQFSIETGVANVVKDCEKHYHNRLDLSIGIDFDLSNDNVIFDDDV